MGENLPAPTQPSDLDGWSADDLEGWLSEAARTIAEAERRTEEMRLAGGLILYRLRTTLGDGAYGQAVDRIARASGVTVRTLSNWRTAAEANFQLAPPSVRTVARRERVAQETLPKRALGRGSNVTAPPTVPAEEKRSPAPLPQPRTQQDYRRLVSLLVTAGAETLRTSVPAGELVKAREVLRRATATEAVVGVPALARREVTPMFKSGKK